MQSACFTVCFLLCFFSCLLYFQPLVVQHIDIPLEILLGGSFCGSADNDAGVPGNNVPEDTFQAFAFRIRQFSGDTGTATIRHIHQITSRHGNLSG